MHKQFNRSLVLAAVSGLMLAQGSTALAGGSTNQSEIDELKAQVQMLIQQNQQLNARLSEMEQGSVQATTTKAAIEEEVSKQIAAKKPGQSINDYVSLSGSIEGDYKLSQGADGANTSEFVLDTVELILEAQITDWASGTIVIDYEGDDDEEGFYLDEANITLGKTETFPYYLTAGKLYVPFGYYATNMIQDPLTQQLGEINPKGVILGYEANGITATVFSYNGIDEGDADNDTINGYGASLSYAQEQENMGFNGGIAYVSNLGDSSELSEIVDQNIANEVPAIALNLGMHYDAFSFIGEYIAALDSFNANVLGTNNTPEPKALNLELAYTTSLMDKETVFALGFQTSWEAYNTELPEKRYIGSAAMNVFEGTTIALEYFIDEFYQAQGSEDDGYGFTTRLTYEF